VIFREESAGKADASSPSFLEGKCLSRFSFSASTNLIESQRLVHCMTDVSFATIELIASIQRSQDELKSQHHANYRTRINLGLA